MIKIEADTLEEAYANAAASLKCSVTELKSEVVQHPKKGYLGVFKKTAIIVADIDENKRKFLEPSINETRKPIEEKEVVQTEEIVVEVTEEKEKSAIVDKVKSKFQNILHTKKEPEKELTHIEKTAKSVQEDINTLFDLTCFKIEKITVSAYDDETILVEFKGEDAALLIGKEGYRYKAISYMLFNWINATYKVQLRLEIAEFLKNQEESVAHYVKSVCETIDAEGSAQTKVLDGVLVQIALKELRERYPEKYVVIRTTHDGLKYIVINDYHSN